MTRFWMSVDEAIDLILLALERASPGAVIVPPARAMKIVDVARAATQDGVDVEVIGERPGEKRDEMLMHYEESVRSLLHRDPMHYELLPPGNSLGKEAFTLASHSPNHWMKVSEMRRLIADAEEV
jgi:FlaA1/EpsC-like NDP-sugar epimerase